MTEVEDRLRVLEAVLDAPHRLADAGPVSEIVDRAPAECARALELDRCVLSRIDDGTLVAEGANLTDGDPATAWTTETYETNRFGGLKPGVGVVLRFSGQGKVEEVKVTSPTRGWSARVYVADGPKGTLAEWGEPVESKSGINGGTTTFSLDGRHGGAVLLWITDPGNANALSIGEIRVTS